MTFAFKPQRVVPLPNLSLSKTIRRLNLSEMDRAKFYYWNGICVLLTALPIAHLLKYNHYYSRESETLVKKMKAERLDKQPTKISLPCLFNLRGVFSRQR
eukprot:Blabericola_migrator_1__916@NODE_1226_length_5052_cov_80_009629_g831_i0_p4_GENE_NODE_1226_length_5052_cov_80_009629_g831_i0NODE_1226_length_5052_cov_80_009629_g831_i0_p4_ORF_typecomplete_len100_score22_91DUF3637/PF12337_8/0_18DUF3637/PF12337_8/1_9e03_NODE_1226_length_5052_cov_80_009629_g831_i014491748